FRYRILLKRRPAQGQGHSRRARRAQLIQSTMQGLFQSLIFITRHPLNRKRKAAALGGYIRWQIGSRLLPGAVAVPFVDSTRLLVTPGMTGATGNVYCGLHEFEEMAFVLHALRPGDFFADISANIGSYTVLASGAAGANSFAFEPSPLTFARLSDNIRLNKLEPRVIARNMAVGSGPGLLKFTTELDCVNHVLAHGESSNGAIEVLATALDEILRGQPLTLMKIDVEGYETQVIDGAVAALQSSSLLAVVIETNGSGSRYGYDESELHSRILAWNFRPVRYEPLRRELIPVGAKNCGGNTLYVRDLERLRERVREAPRHRVHGRWL
ncbi:MAG: FkbM family methyltransferase, partial [Candidatus Binataceae bacterium]